jgi:DNA invertase Pin-like site-specific DNA recombinase
MPRYRKPERNPVNPYKAQPLPLGRPVAVYYRQSTEGQIGNISTTLQTVDMVEHLMNQGWQRDQIIMIDMDGGISGTKKIKERPGMSYLYDLIEENAIGLVASQDVDRFFRDMAQIETNIFIDACRRSNVQVLTPSIVFDFAHPTQGRYHMQMFREQAQRAADYLEFHIKGRLWKSREYLNLQGQWTGTPVALGFMVDVRTHLPNGERNPNYRKYVPFDRYSGVVAAYFKLFKQFNGNMKQTWGHIERHGPFIPEFTENCVPEGFYFHTNISKRSSITGKLILSRYALGQVLSNAVYIGHWAHSGVIVQRHNHEGIVPLEDFIYAFNKLSPVDFNGDPNPEHTPQRPWIRHDKANRPVPPPTYSGAVFSPDVPGIPQRRMLSHWESERQVYVYALYDGEMRKQWEITSTLIDQVVDRMLLERLRATTIDETAWQKAVSGSSKSAHVEVRRIENAIRNAENAQRGIVENLKSVAYPELVKQLEESYIASEQEIAQLQAELKRLQSDQGQRRLLLEARPVLEKVIAHWNSITREDRRELFDGFAERVLVSKVDVVTRRITVYWRDGTETTECINRSEKYYPWSDAEREKLRQMVERAASQIELLVAFPGANWRMIRERFVYHFGIEAWHSIYKGKKSRYGPYIRWEDTEEYHQTNHDTQLATSAVSSYPFEPPAHLALISPIGPMPIC